MRIHSLSRKPAVRTYYWDNSNLYVFLVVASQGVADIARASVDGFSCTESYGSLHRSPQSKLTPVAGPRREYFLQVAVDGGPGAEPRPLHPTRTPQMESLRAFAGKAFTIFLAGFAATFTSFPNIILLPAFVAGLCLSFYVTRCGIANFSVFLTSTFAMLTSAPNATLMLASSSR